LAAVVPLPPSDCQLVTAVITSIELRDEYVRSDGTFDAMAADLLCSVGAEDYISLNGEHLHLSKSWG
jgi:hypothetical protein